MAKGLATKGARVVVADLDDRAGGGFARELTDAGLTAMFHHLDVTDQGAWRQLAEDVREQFGAIGILCANAGIYPVVPLVEMTEADWDRVLDVNLKGMFFSVKACLGDMREGRYGRIVLTSSITGPLTGIHGLAHYGAAKAGVVGFMRTAALELAPDGITINAVMPGNVLTPGYTGAGLDEEYVRQTEGYIPLGRLGQPEDIANAAVFLASEETGYITGQTIVIDGGQVLPETPLAS
jgi:3-oxoacyl-[acyl-carrier protein] reductase